MNGDVIARFTLELPGPEQPAPLVVHAPPAKIVIGSDKWGAVTPGIRGWMVK